MKPPGDFLFLWRLCIAVLDNKANPPAPTRYNFSSQERGGVDHQKTYMMLDLGERRGVLVQTTRGWVHMGG